MSTRKPSKRIHAEINGKVRSIPNTYKGGFDVGYALGKEHEAKKHAPELDEISLHSPRCVMALLDFQAVAEILSCEQGRLAVITRRSGIRYRARRQPPEANVPERDWDHFESSSMERVIAWLKGEDENASARP
jgi:hypothetical protein